MKPSLTRVRIDGTGVEKGADAECYWLAIEFFSFEDELEWKTHMWKRYSCGSVVSYERDLVAYFTSKLN